MRRNNRPPLFLVVAGVTVIGVSAPATAQKYVVTDLGTLGGTKNIPITINNFGQVVGYSSTSGDMPAFAYRTKANQPINSATDNLGVLAGGTSSAATGINNKGQVAGFTSYGGSTSTAFRDDPGQPLLDLGTFVSSSESSSTSGINDSAQVVGQSNVDNPCMPGSTTSHAFVTTAAGSVTSATDLGTLVPAPNAACGFSVATGLNDSGYVVGWSTINTTYPPLLYHAHLASPGSSTLLDLGSLGGAGFSSFAYAINRSGQIVGQSAVSATILSHAFLTTAVGPMHDLGTLGGTFSDAEGINSSGQIVGSATLADEVTQHGFLYTGGVMEDVNALIPTSSLWEIQNANGINDRGQIIGTGFYNGTPNLRGVRLDPVNVAITILLEQIPNLGLTVIQKFSLSLPLVVALVAVEVSDYSVAIKQLKIFISEVGVLAGGGHLSAAASTALTASTNAIIASL